MSKLILKGLAKHYGKTVAVDEIDLALEEGEFVSLLGPSGCGKTTTLRMIAGFIPPTKGEIVIDGQVVSSPSGVVPPERREMSMIFQSYAIWPNMTVEQNVGFGLELRKLPNAEIQERIGRILEVVQMQHLAKRYPSELSGGQQQRVALARAVVVQPKVLLLDEPLSNLDANLREEMRFEIRRLHDEFRITTVYVTHDQGEAMVTSDRVAVMNAGRIEQCDDPFTVYTRPKTRFVAGFIGRTNFLTGRRDGGDIRFDGFSLPADAFEGALNGSAQEIAFSVRPQSLTLQREDAPPDGPHTVRAAIRNRAFLGELWDYVVMPENSGLNLRVSAPPWQVFDVDERVWLKLDPAQVAVIG